MKMRSINSALVEAPPAGTYTQCKVYDGHFFVSGVTANTPGSEASSMADMYDQAKKVFQRIESLVKAAGAEMNDIVQLNIFVVDIGRIEGVWRARREFFSNDFPCSTLVEVSALAAPHLLVEINAQGFVGAGV